MTVRHAQEQDPKLKAVLQYLETDAANDEYADYIQHESQYFELYKTILWRSEVQYPELRVEVPIKERKVLIPEL